MCTTWDRQGQTNTDVPQLGGMSSHNPSDYRRVLSEIEERVRGVSAGGGGEISGMVQT